MKVTQWQKLLSWLLVLVMVDITFVLPEAAIGLDLGARFRALFSRQSRVGVARNRRVGGAIRDPDLCRRVELPLTALVPDTDEPVKTSDEHPTFWFYIPYALNPNLASGNSTTGSSTTTGSSKTNTTSNNSETYTLKFVLQDEQNNDVYRAKFAMSETTKPGVYGIRFLSPKAALEVGKRYQWYFLIYCNDQQEIYEPAFVSGLIQREALSTELQNQIAQEEPQKRFLAYAEARLWYDTLTALEINRSSPELNSGNSTVSAEWAQVLQSVGLSEKISQQPIVGRYYISAEN